MKRELKVNYKIWEALQKPQPIIVIYGGRGSGKSLGVGDCLTQEMESKGHDIYCLREFQESLSDSVHRVFLGSIEDRLQLPGWDIQQSTVIAPSGAKTVYKGANRSPDAMQSAQSFLRSWFEEAHRASKASLDKLLPTIIRNPGAKCIFTANPQSSGDAFSQRFIVPYQAQLDSKGYYEDDLHYIVKVNWRDNPWWNDEQEKLRKWDYEHRPRAEYDWIWEGKFNDQVENSIIKAEWFDAALDAHKILGFKPRGQKQVVHDPSDTGDARAYILRHGNVIQQAEENTQDDVNDACDWSLDAAIGNKVDVYRWDYSGLGLSLKRQVNDSLDGKKILWEGFLGNETPEDPEKVYEPVDGGTRLQNKKNKELFRNRRAQCYWRLRDRFYLTYRAVNGDREIPVESLISIDTDIECIEKMRSEICRIPLKNSGTGLIQIMSKDEMKNKHDINSPNIADCMMMSESNPMKVAQKHMEPLNYNTKGYV